MSRSRILQTGQYIAGCRTHGTYVRVECAEDEWRVFVGVPTMTQAELDRFRSGVIRFTAVRMDACLFFLFQFEDGAWERAPYLPRTDDLEPSTEDAQMTFVFVDSDSGVAQELRTLKLRPNVTAFLVQHCEALRAVPSDRETDLKRTKELLRQYPTSDAMLQANPSTIFTL